MPQARTLLLGFALVLPGFAAARPVNFDRDVRPILSDKCFACHGPDDKRRMANLRLDTEAGLFAQRPGYKIITPGDPAASRLYARISAASRAARMPPPQATTTLTDAQVAVIREWIEQGAHWERHWAFVAPVAADPPAVRDARWPRNPIDRFVLARLEKENLRPAPEADRATLLRRLSFDLTGLPPTAAELDRFLADPSPTAYEKQVDRLLATPQYGERMAMQWLDLARYADTHGYHIDSHREMWKWRDWVIAAFNRNLPYNQFGIEQLAGDLMPHATLEEKLATGFNRNHMINYEGGAIPEEYHTEYVADRVDTTATVFMGLTLGCARCHDHKYDPILQRDYYRFFAFFNTIAEKGLDGKIGNAAPVLELPTAEQASESAWLEQSIAEHEAALPDKQIQTMLAAWEKTRRATLPEPSGAGLIAQYALDGSLSGGRLVAGTTPFAKSAPAPTAFFNGEAHVEFPAFNAPAFAIAFWMRSGAMPEMTLFSGGPGLEIGVEESHPQPGFRRGSPLYVEWQGRRFHSRSIVYGAQWHHVVFNFDAARPALILDGAPVAMDPVGAAPATPAGPLAIGDPRTGKPLKGDIGDLRIYNRAVTAEEATILALHQPIRYILSLEESKRTKEHQARLRDYFLSDDAPPDFRQAYKELNALKQRQTELRREIASVQVMSEMARPRPTYILARGDYRNHGEQVYPGVPALLPPLPKDAPANRLGLAEWLFSPQHPLTARVEVNRVWQLFFGIGLVKTVEDFGSQGDEPVQRDLLDWLAVQFEKNWDIKALVRTIVTSATYREQSEVTPALVERDPDNRLFARGPRFRLPAEMIRDNALALSRLLVRDIGGPSVFPYQPPGLWEELSRGETFTAQEYHQSHGPDLYRRSMYTFWKRTVPPAALSTFDAPDREKCTARRLITNTPLQALVLLNDPTYIEAARVLAQRAVHEAGADPQARVRFLFREATARRPTPAETALLTDLYQRRLDHYRKQPAQAASLIHTGESKPAAINPPELAAWTMVASTILNLDETVTRE